MAKSFSGTFGKRNKALFVVGHRTGFRISELISLVVSDVQQHGKILDQISVQRRHMKGGRAGKTSGRTVPLHPEARVALSVWLEQLQKILKSPLDHRLPVFCSRVKDPTTGLKRHISREQAWGILKEAFNSNELQGKLGTHAMRKTFCNRVYDKLNHDLVKTQRASGHANINSTVSYLGFREEEIDAAILAAGWRDAMGEVLTIEEVAARLKLTPQTVRDWLNAGKLKGVKLGRVWRVDAEHIEQLLREGLTPEPAKESLGGH